MAKHGKVKDSGEYFVINPASRKVTVPHIHKSIGTVGDHNSEQITFECPQMIDSHDISQCESRYVTWVNVKGEVGHDELQIVQVEQSKEGMLYLSWTIRNGLTVAKGIVQFSVHFEDFNEDGTTLYRWSTATCKDCDILDSVNGVLGAYEAVYVAGDTLVFGDYNVVKDGTLKIETNGLIPEGTLDIKENGTFDVGRYAQVDVSVDENPPEITISEDGKVIAKDGDATSEVQLSNKHDPDFIAENIKSGIEIFGVNGSYDPMPLVSGSIITQSQLSLSFDVKVYFSGKETNGTFKLSNFRAMLSNGIFQGEFVKDLPILISIYRHTTSQGVTDIALGGSGWEKVDDNLCGARGDTNYLIYAIKPNGTSSMSLTIMDSSILDG